MPPLRSRHRLVAGVGLLSLVASLLPLEGLLPSVRPAGDVAPEPPSLLMLGVLGALLSCGWFLLGYALASLLRTAPRAAASPPARPTALSQMTTEQLYRQLERDRKSGV